MPYTIGGIRELNKQAGWHFFDRKTMRFFNSKVMRPIYEGAGGIFFITSEQDYDRGQRHYTVRQFNPKTFEVGTVGGFYGIKNVKDARDKARWLAFGKYEDYVNK